MCFAMKYVNGKAPLKRISVGLFFDCSVAHSGFEPLLPA